jgi:hypothetical protein
MTTKRTAQNEQTHVVPLPLLFLTLTRNIKPQEVFKLNSSKYIIIKVEAYKQQTDHIECCDWQNYCHVWSTWRQHPRTLWCGGGHLHRECPKR